MRIQKKSNLFIIAISLVITSYSFIRAATTENFDPIRIKVEKFNLSTPKTVNNKLAAYEKRERTWATIRSATRNNNGLKTTSIDSTEAKLIDSYPITNEINKNIQQKVYYVSSDGDDNAPGTKEAPWRTLEKASQAEAGNTIIFLSGTFEGVLKPINSGTKKNPIIFRAAEPHKTTLIGIDSNFYHYAVEIKGKNHIHLDGFHIRPQNPTYGRWVELNSDNGEPTGERSRHIYITDFLMEKASGAGGGLGGAGTSIPLRLKNSNYVHVKDNIIREFYGGDMIHVRNMEHLLIEGNSISKAGHSPLAVSPNTWFKSSQFIVIRGNVFHAEWGRPFELFGDPNIVFENNIIINAYHGRHSAGPDAKVMIEDGIFRFNRIFRNWGSPVNLEYQNAGADAKNSRFYNNVFDNNYQQALRISNIVDNKIFKNNIFSRNDRYGGNSQIRFTGNASHFQFFNNVFWSGADKPLLNQQGAPYTVSKVQSQFPEQFRDNMVIDPEFVNIKNYNHALSPNSALRNAAEHLTYAVGDGAGTQISVADAQYFYDGYGIAGELGDLIAVGTASQTARVLHSNYESNTLTLDRTIEWVNGDPVSLSWSGEAPDIGVYEHGQTGRVSIQIDARPFQVETNEPVKIRAITHGLIEAREYKWRLGDGSLAEGSSLIKTYSEPGTYPLFVRVAGEDGNIYIGTGVVDVVEKNHLEKPLVHINYNEDPKALDPNFDKKDTDWWWFWYANRPESTQSYEIDEDGNGVLRISANADNYTVPVRGFPPGWNVDQYPYVNFKYKIQPGMPLSLQIQPWHKIGMNISRHGWPAPKNSAVTIAAVKAVGAKPDDPFNDIAELQDDGRWHEVTIDARAIREKFPHANVIEVIRFQALDSTKIKKGDSFWLDDFSILPTKPPF